MPNRFFKISVFAVIAASLFLALSISAVAQVHTIKGKVTNDKGEPVVGAQIIIRGIEYKRSFDIKTDKKGEYTCMVQNGKYAVGIHAAGYTPQANEGVTTVGASEPVQVDFKLEPGQDYKLPMEMTKEELGQFKQELEKAQKQKSVSGVVKQFLENGIKLASEGKYQEAAEEFKKGLAKDNAQPYIHAQLADAYANLGQNDNALAEFDAAIALKPDEVALLINKGVLLGKMGKTAESQEAFKAAIKAKPSEATKAYFNMGATLVNSGKTEEAAEAFKQAITVDPNNAEAYYQLATCLISKSETIPEGINMFKKYITMGTAAKPDQIEAAKAIISELEKK